MKNKKLILYSLGGIALAVGGYFLYKKITAKTVYFGDVEPDDTPSSKPNKPVESKPVSSKFPLKRGSKGAEVTSLQKFLKAEGQGYLLGKFGANKDGVDGIFGKMTENAVKQQQAPFSNFKMMYPNAVEGQVSKLYFDMFIKGKY